MTHQFPWSEGEVRITYQYPLADDGQLRPLPPAQPQGWVDPPRSGLLDDGYLIEPELIRQPYQGWDQPPVAHRFALVGLGVCIGIIIFALVWTVGRQFDATPQGAHSGVPGVAATWDNAPAGTSSHTDTVSLDARCASPTAGVVARGGLGHAEWDPQYPRVILAADASCRSLSGMAGWSGSSGIRKGRVPGQGVGGSSTCVGANEWSNPPWSTCLPPLRQPALCRAGPSLSRDTDGQLERSGSQGSRSDATRSWGAQPSRKAYDGRCAPDSRDGGFRVEPQEDGQSVWSGEANRHKDREGPQLGLSEVGSAIYTASATWCAPTPDKCTDWGGNARLAAVNSFVWGDEPYPVRVWRGEQYVDVTVVSHCGCFGEDGYIDLSPAAFEVLAPLGIGRIDVEVEVLTDLPPHPDDDRMRVEDGGPPMPQTDAL